MKIRGAILDVFLLPNREMVSMKRRLLKKTTEPNVLAFPEPKKFPHPETKKHYLGEIYLNEDILVREPRRGPALLAHGLLHLLGHDHVKATDATVMERLEGKLANPFRRPLKN